MQMPNYDNLMKHSFFRSIWWLVLALASQSHFQIYKTNRSENELRKQNYKRKKPPQKNQINALSKETKAQRLHSGTKNENQIIFISDTKMSEIRYTLIQIEKPVAKSVIMIAENFDKQNSFSYSLCLLCAPNGDMCSGILFFNRAFFSILEMNLCVCVLILKTL